MAATALVAILVLGLGVAWPQENRDRKSSRDVPATRAKKTHELWFFFSPTGPDLSKDVRRLREFLEKHPEISFRPCLLVDDFGAIEKPSPELGATLKELRSLWSLAEEQNPGPFSIRVWDEEGLAFARELGIEHLPSYALVAAGPDSGTASGSGGARRGARAHVVQGQGCRFEELIRCTSK